MIAIGKYTEAEWIDGKVDAFLFHFCNFLQTSSFLLLLPQKMTEMIAAYTALKSENCNFGKSHWLPQS